MMRAGACVSPLLGARFMYRTAQRICPSIHCVCTVSKSGKINLSAVPCGLGLRCDVIDWFKVGFRTEAATETDLCEIGGI